MTHTLAILYLFATVAVLLIAMWPLLILLVIISLKKGTRK